MLYLTNAAITIGVKVGKQRVAAAKAAVTISISLFSMSVLDSGGLIKLNDFASKEWKKI